MFIYIGVRRSLSLETCSAVRALMLENLQRSSAYHSGIQPNSQIGEEMSQNSFIKQYLAKQQELLRQRLEKEAREATEADESQKSSEEQDEDDDSPTKDGASFLTEKQHFVHLSSGGGLPHDPGLISSQKLDACPVPVSQETGGKPGRIWHPSFLPSHEEIPTPSPPRAVASLSVRVVGQPEHQGLPIMMPRSQEKEGTAPAEAGPAHSVLQLSRSAKVAAGNQVESEEEDEDDDSEDDDDDNEEWGPSALGNKNVQQPPVHPPVAVPQRSRRKLQPPQHIPPQPQLVHQPPLQLRQPTPPPSPPPELSFPLPDTPKQSPHEQDEPAEAPGPGTVSPPSFIRQESSSSSRSSSPEPPSKRRPGPLSLLARKMESEGVFSGPPKVEVEDEAEMEVEEHGCGEMAPKVSAKRHTLDMCPSEPTVSSTKHSRLEKETENEERNKKEVKKVDESLGSVRLTFPMSSKRIFSEVPPPDSLKSPLKPQQASDLSKDAAFQAEAATKPESKHKEDKELKVLKKLALEESPKSEESKRVLKFVSTQEEAYTSQRKIDLKQHASTSSQSSSDDDDDSDTSSSRSSSSPSHDKSRSQKKGVEEKGRKNAVEEKKQHSSREVKQEALAESASQVTMELEGLSNSQSAVDQSDHQGPDTSDSHPEENSGAKSFAARKISLNSKAEIPSSESDPVGGASRKRRWGSSTAVTAKKPSISITTESLKTLIPEIKPLQEAVVDLHPNEGRLSADEDSPGPHEREEPEEDQGLKIRRTVTQIVPSVGHENGQKEMEDEEDQEDDEEQTQKEGEKEKQRREEISPEATIEPQEVDSIKVTPNDLLVRRSISQQKSGVSITIDDPIRTSRQISPPNGKTSKIIHVCNLVRPFTLGQLKLLLNQTGTLVEEGFWIDKIKSHCYVTYTTTEEAVATREALHGVKWPASNPKVLRVDFCDQDELDFHKGLITGERTGDVQDPQASGVPRRSAPHPPMNHEKEKEREKERGPVERGGGPTTVRDQWAERERAMARRERTRSEREWDRDKVKDFGRDERERPRRSRSRERRHRGKSKEKRSEKKVSVFVLRQHKELRSVLNALKSERRKERKYRRKRTRSGKNGKIEQKAGTKKKEVLEEPQKRVLPNVQMNERKKRRRSGTGRKAGKQKVGGRATEAALATPDPREAADVHPGTAAPPETDATEKQHGLKSIDARGRFTGMEVAWMTMEEAGQEAVGGEQAAGAPENNGV
ncbi:hypothetical protein DNTS_014235, partial [Danionella cerebrum]